MMLRTLCAGLLLLSWATPVLSAEKKPVIGVVDYVANYYGADVTVDNLTSCPIEIRNFKINPRKNAKGKPEPYVGWPKPINVLNQDESPTSKANIPAATVHPEDECKPYSFDYSFDYNFVIRKHRVLINGSNPVESKWVYDVPACKPYTNDGLEETYQRKAKRTVEIRPGIRNFSQSWPNKDLTFNFSPYRCDTATKVVHYNRFQQSSSKQGIVGSWKVKSPYIDMVWEFKKDGTLFDVRYVFGKVSSRTKMAYSIDPNSQTLTVVSQGQKQKYTYVLVNNTLSFSGSVFNRISP